ncbi:hypothetical protein FRC17_006461 [Serendipita sp. 399]|nr:hypothetical protein FRC17_006461 [Serendipita sp. 399]
MSPSRQSNYVESIIHGPAVSVVPRERWQRNSQRRDEATASDASLGTDRFLWAIQTATPGWSRNQILHSLRQIREFGDADDYTLACEAISLNGHDLQKCSALLTQIRRFGSKEDYSDALLIVASYEEDLTSTRDWLWRIRGLGSQEDYTIALATTTTHCFDFKNVEATLKWFWELSQGASNYSLTLKFLRSRSYVFSSTKDDLLKLKRVTGDPQQYFHALLLLEGSNFSIEDTLKQLHNDAQAPLPQPPSITVNYSSSHIFNPPFPGGFAPQVAPYPPALPIHNDRPFQFPTPSTSRDTNTASLGSTAGRVVASKRSLPPESALNAPTSSNHRRQRSSQAALAGGKGPVTDSRSDSNRLFARLYPSPQEQREIARNYRVSGRKLEELLQALNQLNLRGAELIYLGKILRRQTFDYDGVQRQVLEVASTLPDRLDFSWALEFLSQFLGDWMAMRSIFGPDVSGVQTLVSFFRTREISAQIIIDYLSTDGPKGKDAQRCALKLWQRYNLGRQGATEEINNLLQLAKGNSGMFSVILYLLEKNNFDREKTPGHWASLIKAMGGERSDKCVQRMETYALQGLKSTPEAPESTVNGFLRLLALTRSGPYSTVSDDDNLDAGLQLLQSTNFNFQEVINVLSAHRGLTASKLVGGFPVLLKLAKDGRYNLVEAHQTIAYFLGPQMSLTDVEAVRLLEKHQWSKDALLASRSLA